MGVYLVPFDLAGLDEMAGGGYAIVDVVLRRAGLAGLATVDGKGPGFEEKMTPDMASFSRLCEELLPRLDVERPQAVEGSVPHPFPASVAEVWLPLQFSGLLLVEGVEGVYSDELTIGSSIEIAAQCTALAGAIGFPLSEVPPLMPEGYVLNEWYEGLAPSDDRDDPVWRTDPDIAFYLALFGSVAGYSITWNEAVGYC